MITTAFRDTIEVVDTALEVLKSESRNHELVKKMINKILGSGDGQEDRLDRVKSEALTISPAAPLCLVH